MALGRIVDCLIFVSIEGYLRGQDDVGDMLFELEKNRVEIMELGR
jgi:hypothetical protein